MAVAGCVWVFALGVGVVAIVGLATGVADGEAVGIGVCVGVVIGVCEIGIWGLAPFLVAMTMAQVTTIVSITIKIAPAPFCIVQF